MTGRVAVVTDSTAHLAAEVLDEHCIKVVPLQVVIGEKSLDDDAGLGPGEVAEALRSYVPVNTSRPSPRTFLDVYESVAASGAGSVVSIHLSGSLSGTADSARLAGRDSPIPVHVVDSRSLGMGLGFAVVAAARAAERGLTADEVAEAAATRARASSAFFYVDTLEHLRRGGRMGAASTMVGTALGIKPLLHLRDGWIEPLEKVRTSSRAVARLEDLAAERALSATSTQAAGGGGARVDIAVHHLDNGARAGELSRRLAERLAHVHDVVVSEVDAVIGAHVGPGLLAVVVSPR